MNSNIIESKETVEEQYEKVEGMKSNETELTKILLMRAFVERQDPSSKVSIDPPFYCLCSSISYFTLLFNCSFFFWKTRFITCYNKKYMQNP
jgi:hypothetical protein